MARSNDPPPNRRVSTGDELGPGGATVAKFLNAWLSGRRSLRASTIASYEVHVRRHLAPALGDIHLERADRDEATVPGIPEENYWLLSTPALCSDERVPRMLKCSQAFYP